MVFALKHTIYSIVYNIWLNRRHISPKVSFPESTICLQRTSKVQMVGTKSRGYSNSGQFSEGKYSALFLAPFPALLKSQKNDDTQFDKTLESRILDYSGGGPIHAGVPIHAHPKFIQNQHNYTINYKCI